MIGTDREQVDDEADDLVEGQPAEVAEAAAEDEADRDPSADAGAEGRRPAGRPHHERDRREHRRQRESGAEPWRQQLADDDRGGNRAKRETKLRERGGSSIRHSTAELSSA